MTEGPILVSGDAGFVGARLLSKLAASGARPLPFCEADGNRVDLRDRAAVDRLVAQVRPAAIVHLAAIASPREARDDRDGAWQVNVDGTLNLVSAIRRHSPESRLVFAGSSEAYGQSFNEVASPVDEDAPLKPTSAYGATKAACDVALGQLHHEGLRIVRFRPFNHTGPGQTAAYVVPAFAEQVARMEAGLQEPVVMVGNLEAERDFLDVDDVVAAYAAAALGQGGRDGEVYNLSTGRPVPVASLLDMLREHSRVKFEVRVDPDRWAPNAVPVASGSFARAERDLGWRPTTPIAETVARVLQDCRERLS